MARPRLYLTDDKKKAASRLKSQRYYEKNKSRINRARRKKYSKTASQVQKSKIKLESTSMAEDSVHSVDTSLSESNITDCNIEAVLTLEVVSEDEQIEATNVTDVSSSAEDSDEPSFDYVANWEISEDEQIEAEEVTDVSSSADDSDEPPFNCLTNWEAQIQDIEELFDKFVEKNPARFMELAAQRYQENLSMASLDLAAGTLGIYSRSIIACQSHILQLAGPHSDAWIRSECSRMKVQTSIDWIEEIICAALIGPEEVTIMVRKSEFSYQAK